MLQEHMVATHIGADKSQSKRPSIVPASTEESEAEWQNIQSTRKQFGKHAGEVDWIWSQEHPGAPSERPARREGSRNLQEVL